jgi:hypothetical protein
MTVKVHYDPQTTLVKGYYPDSINYSSIPEPFIEISDEEHKDISGAMRVIDGALKEYITPDSILLEQGKISKTAQCKIYLNSTDWQIITFTERGRAIDESVTINRPLAVTLQQDIANCTTLEELNNINTNFS